MKYTVIIGNLHKFYKDLHVLRGINLSIQEGEIVSVIGPSGSGKSTLARCIVGLEKVDSGTIELCGINITDGAVSNREMSSMVGMIFQHLNLFPHLTALNNIALALVKVKGMNKEAARQQSLHYLERVGLNNKINMRPGQLSGGQQQRVAIARALALEPRIMLFDEPTSALDPELVGEILSVMADLAHTGMTMIAITHEMMFAREVSNKVVFIDEGIIVEEGDPHLVLTNPAHPRTKEFLRRLLTHNDKAFRI